MKKSIENGYISRVFWLGIIVVVAFSLQWV